MHPRERLAQFEDEKLGVDAPRQFGKPERGHGSRFQRLSDADKREYGLLEELVAAEDAVEAAQSALITALQRRAEAEKKAGVAPPPAASPDASQPPEPPSASRGRPRKPKKPAEPAPPPAEPEPEPAKEGDHAPDISQEPAAEPSRD